MSKEKVFSKGDYVVYPTHGVGQVTGIEKQDISGISMEVIVVNFAKEKMTLRVPVGKSVSSGMRPGNARESSFGVLPPAGRGKETMASATDP